LDEPIAEPGPVNNQRGPVAGFVEKLCSHGRARWGGLGGSGEGRHASTAGAFEVPAITTIHEYRQIDLQPLFQGKKDKVAAIEKAIGELAWPGGVNEHGTSTF
jgi:hypothetical protein